METVNTLVEKAVAVCDFDPGYWLIFGPNVGPLQYYSHLPIIVLALGLALFIFSRDPKRLPNQILFLTTIPFAAWVFFDSIIWATNRSDVIMFMWSLQVLIEPLVYIGAFYLLYTLTMQRDAPFWAKLSAAILYLPVIIAAPTVHNLSGFNLVDCLAEEGFVGTYYTYGFELVLVLSLLYFATYQFIRATSDASRNKIVLLTTGTLLFLGAFSWGNIIGSITGDWQLAQFGLFGMPIFLGFLVYSTIQYQTFNTQIIGSVALIFGLIALSFSLLFVQDVSVFRGVAAATFLFVLIFSAFLVRTILRDIEASKQIERLAHELELANRGQESLIHFVSHEVKGVLAKCINVMSLVSDGDYGPVSDQVKSVLKRGLADTRAAVDMVLTILLSANIKSGAIKFKFASFDLRAGIRAVLTDLADDAKSKGLELVFESDSTDEYLVEGDQEMLTKHVARNLIDNSIRYTPHGTITIRLKKEPAAVLLSITDTGVGISKEDMARLFTEGGKGRDSSRVNVNSTGYGLFFARQLVEAHHGRIWAESAGEGRGSTFYVRVPRTQSSL